MFARKFDDMISDRRPGGSIASEVDDLKERIKKLEAIISGENKK
jgi:tetrahydromethanopterin S-methyltransferase subunit B